MVDDAEGVADAVFGDEAVEDVEDGVAVVGVEVGEVGDAVGEFVVGAGEGSAGCGVDDEVVDGHVEGLGEADEHVDAGGDALVLVAADALTVGAEALAEFGLGPAVFFAELLDAFAEGHLGASGGVLESPLCAEVDDVVVTGCVHHAP